jgi:hypothetical protein
MSRSTTVTTHFARIEFFLPTGMPRDCRVSPFLR